MRWLASKAFDAIFGGFAPIVHFVGDHRYGTIALLLIVAAVAAWIYLPVVGRQTAKALLVVAVAFGFFDWGYSHRAAIDRVAWEQAEAARKAAEEAERARRASELAKARRDADAAEQALHAQMEEHARYMVEIDNVSKANDNRPCLDRAGVLRIDRIGRRKKAR
ncbi:MAG: hypothetical protein FJX45_18475 [Alphaproteobacteria bacterium]|nr:hypothetical protein [Alphaproteobacteria bacterium]